MNAMDVHYTAVESVDEYMDTTQSADRPGRKSLCQTSDATCAANRLVSSR